MHDVFVMNAKVLIPFSVFFNIFRHHYVHEVAHTVLNDCHTLLERFRKAYGIFL